MIYFVSVANETGKFISWWSGPSTPHDLGAQQVAQYSQLTGITVYRIVGAVDHEEAKLIAERMHASMSCAADNYE